MNEVDTKVAEHVASAVRNGDIDEVRRALTDHPACLAFLDVPEEIAGSKADSWSEYAEQHGHDELAKILQFDFPDPVLRGIYRAISMGDEKRIAELIAAHARYAHGRPGQLERMLIDAAHENQVGVARMLLRMGADVNRRRFTTALSNAVDFAGTEMVRYLLSKGADPNGERERVVIGAISREPEDLALRLVKLLVEHGADVNREYTVFGDKNNTFTALEWAAGKPKIAEYLRSKGAVERQKKLAATDRPESLTEEITAYFEKHFGQPMPQARIEIVLSEPPVAIHVIPATSDRKYVTLFTTGMSKEPMQVPDQTDDFRFAELFIQLPADWPTDRKALSDGQFAWPLHWLRSIAKYPHQNQTWLGGPVTIIANGDPPEALTPGLTFTSLLVMADRDFTARDGRKIYLYRLTPLYTEERDLEIQQGIAALMNAFDKHDIPPVVDLKRPNVASAKGQES